MTLDTAVAAPAGQLERALVAAQADLQNPLKTETADMGNYRYTYAPLPDILDAVRPVLHHHGLAIVQQVEDGPAGQVGVRTILVHESGQTVHGGIVSLPAKTPQQAGAVITYLRRYSLCALLGIAGDEDTDTSGPVAGGGPSPGASAQDPGPGYESEGGMAAAEDPRVQAERPRDEPVGSSTPSGSPSRYPIRQEDCSHRFPSGSLLPADGDGRCPKCGMQLHDAGGGYE